MVNSLESLKKALEGRYTIEREIGAGGMGVVYLARDIRLERLVAIKTLPGPRTVDPEHLARFRREAKLLAALNHPNIATIHGLEEPPEGALHIVLEWIDGETLAQLLAAGPMRLRDGLGLCRQIAEALDAAHAAGIIHRDLKPSNVMLVQGKRIKVLDFGLARRVAESVGHGRLESLATTLELGDPSRIMGTPGYASPEQLRGEELDPRTDVFSLGCVLYECLTGRRAFPGASPLETVATCLERQPDWSWLPEDTPHAVRRLLEACLAKDRAGRPHARDVLGVLERALDVPPDTRRGLSDDKARKLGVHLPRDLTSFVGRGREIEECSELCGSCRLLTLTGSGGCGKTRLAIRLAWKLRDSYPDGIWFVDLASVRDPSHVAHATASSLGLREESERALTATLVNHLRSARGLLLLDNCEHVLEAAAALASELLQGTESLTILTTSREPLGLRAERTYRVPSLALPDPDVASLETLRRSEASRLFEERAAFVSPGFELTDRIAPTVSEICRKLDGIPLAIELAAARVRALSVEDIRLRLSDRLGLLTSHGRGIIPRHQTLRAAIQWSHDLLTELERHLFHRLAVFSGGWTVEAARSVCGFGRDDLDMLDLLTRLIDKSLIVMERASGGVTRYRMSETLGQFALEKLEESGEEAEFRGRHLGYFSRIAEAAEIRLMGAEQGAAVEELESDHENLLGALRWCERIEDGPEIATRITAGIWRFWYVRAYFGIAAEILSRVLSARKSAAPTVPLLKTLNGAGLIAINQRNFTAAEAHYRQCLEASREMGDELRIAGAYNGLGAVAGQGQGDYDAARRYFEECLAIYRRLADGRGTAISLLNIGEAMLRQGEPGCAIPLLEESLALRRKIGDTQGIVATLNVLAPALVRSGNRDSARHCLLECLELVRAHGLRARTMDALQAVAELAEAVDDPERAALLCGAASAAGEALGAPRTSIDLREERPLLIRLKSHLGGERFRRVWERGSEQVYESALAEAHEWLQRGAKTM